MLSSLTISYTESSLSEDDGDLAALLILESVAGIIDVCRHKSGASFIVLDNDVEADEACSFDVTLSGFQYPLLANITDMSLAAFFDRQMLLNVCRLTIE